MNRKPRIKSIDRLVQALRDIAVSGITKAEQYTIGCRHEPRQALELRGIFRGVKWSVVLVNETRDWEASKKSDGLMGLVIGSTEKDFSIPCRPLRNWPQRVAHRLLSELEAAVPETTLCHTAHDESALSFSEAAGLMQQDKETEDDTWRNWYKSLDAVVEDTVDGDRWASMRVSVSPPPRAASRWLAFVTQAVSRLHMAATLPPDTYWTTRVEL